MDFTKRGENQTGLGVFVKHQCVVIILLPTAVDDDPPQRDFGVGVYFADETRFASTGHGHNGPGVLSMANSGNNSNNNGSNSSQFFLTLASSSRWQAYGVWEAGGRQADVAGH